MATLRELRRRALVAGFPLAVAALNRAGLGPLRADVSGAELRRAGLRAMGEVAARLGLGDAYVVFGHTHRAGPLPGDDEQEWRGRGGRPTRERRQLDVRVDLPRAHRRGEPLLAGRVRARRRDGRPQVLRLLQDRSREELRGSRRAARACDGECGRALARAVQPSAHARA